MEESTKIVSIEISQKAKEKQQKQQQKKEKEEQRKIQEKEKKKRVITEHKLWIFSEEELSNENQWLELNKPEDKLNRWLTSQIKTKIYGYLGQDVEKREREKNKIVDPETAIQINLSNILKKLIDSNLNCFYCREKVRILYEGVRDPKQWTLERINNKEGHHLENLEIACLQCNLRRRTMYHERYVFTKQMNIIKTG
jgi:hypothetical protein